jgi:hypothetical protein
MIMNQFMCQFKCVPNLTHEASSRVIFIEKLRALALRLKRTVNSLKNDLKLKKGLTDIKGAWKTSERNIISAGNKVRVLSQEDIRNMLDYRGIYKGCPFLGEQYSYCGNTYEVLKEVNYFYDERKNKLCKCKDIVVIEGTFCSGKQKLYSESCDLNCYFFWHKDWLEIIE